MVKMCIRDSNRRSKRKRLTVRAISEHPGGKTLVLPRLAGRYCRRSKSHRTCRPLPSPGEFNLACRKGSAAEHAAGFLARMEEGGAGCLWVERPPLTEMLLHGITECFQNTKVLMQDGVDLFEIQVPVDMDQDIPKSRQIREIGNERFREDPLIPEDLELSLIHIYTV